MGSTDVPPRSIQAPQVPCAHASSWHGRPLSLHNDVIRRGEEFLKAELGWIATLGVLHRLNVDIAKNLFAGEAHLDGVE